MSVAFDANATANTGLGTAGTTLDNGNLTVGSGSNRVLIAQFCFIPSVAPGNISSVKWDPAGANQSLEAIANDAVGGGSPANVYIYGLVNPTSGNKILRLTWTGSSKALLNVTSFTGADQTGGTTTFAHANNINGSGTSPSLAITSATGNVAVVSALVEWQALSAPTQTETYVDPTTAYELEGAGAYGAGAATVTFGWTLTPGDAWAIVGCDIVAAAGGGAGGLMWL